MIPPLVRRCPKCGHVGLSREFTALAGEGPTRVECPTCRHRFEPVDQPWLQ